MHEEGYGQEEDGHSTADRGDVSEIAEVFARNAGRIGLWNHQKYFSSITLIQRHTVITTVQHTAFNRVQETGKERESATKSQGRGKERETVTAFLFFLSLSFSAEIYRFFFLGLL